MFKVLRNTRCPKFYWSSSLFQAKIEHEPVSGKTEEEVRVSSAKSRASLRKEFKNRLEETRNVVEDRRAKSPAISIPSQKSLDDDQLIVDDEEEDDLPIPDDLKGLLLKFCSTPKPQYNTMVGVQANFLVSYRNQG